MSEETTPHVDPRDNAEVRTVQESGSRENARASDSGPVPSPARDPQDPLGLEDDVADGTGQGNPIAGVEISEEDAANAVPADQGPEGTR
ncbi:hypothetical protein AB1207_10750 [Kineococcus endophyticus]|uniref:Uncharacterized protein n=1 Tax=Kineococcus endophyticus TaxID=1181883 RepID=A0ABV3P6Q2_9ACTN